MDSCLERQSDAFAWQATIPIFTRHFKDKLMLVMNGTECVHVQSTKELTIEAVSMIVVITIFIVFATMGSLSTVYEFFYVENTRKKKPKVDNKNWDNGLTQEILKEYANERNTKDSTTELSQSVIKNKYSNEKDYNLPQNETEKSKICKGWLRNSRSFLQCFCFIKNGKKLFQTDSDKEQFECFRGIRFISCLVVIFAHVFLLFYIPTRRNIDKAKPILQGPISYFFFFVTFTMDVFFVLSGFLNAYSFSKEFNKNKGKICLWNFYLKRFIRITFLYMIMSGFYTTLLNYTGSGPIWPDYVTNPICKETWWWYLLYINNFLSHQKMCMIWCWFLATDMQFFIVSPIFLLSLLRWQGFGYGLASITIFLSCLSSFVITKHYNLIDQSKLGFYVDDIGNFMDRFWLYFDKVHTKPYTRISSYLIGILLGYHFCQRKCKDLKNNWITLWCGWLASGSFMWILFYSVFKREELALENALYHGVKDLISSAALSWLIYACLTRQGGFINTLLSWKLFSPFSKLSYCAYLIHMIILQQDYQAAQKLEEFSLLSLTFNGLYVCFWTFVFSIPVSLLFEMPIINLFELFMRK